MQKGQASMDYLILLAILLLLAIVAIALFDAFPDFARGIQTKHSQDFWKNQARPFSLEEAFYDKSTGRLYMAVKSHSSEELKITGIFINGTQLSLFGHSAEAPEGVGSPYCSLPACKLSGCSCQLNVSPFSTRAVTTEHLAPPSEVCGQKIQNAILELQIIYSDRQSRISNYSQASAFPLIAECKDSFNS